MVPSYSRWSAAFNRLAWRKWARWNLTPASFHFGSHRAHRGAPPHGPGALRNRSLTSGAIVLLQPVPLFRLGRVDEIEDIAWDEAELPIVLFRRAATVSARRPLRTVGRSDFTDDLTVVWAGVGPAGEKRALDHVFKSAF